MKLVPLRKNICFTFLSEDEQVNFMYANNDLFQISQLSLPEKTGEE